jgi:hypothetical protein
MPDFKYYILVCAGFNPAILTSYQENWNIIKGALCSLMEKDDAGFVHCFQAVIQLFIKKFPDQ